MAFCLLIPRMKNQFSGIYLVLHPLQCGVWHYFFLHILTCYSSFFTTISCKNDKERESKEVNPPLGDIRPGHLVVVLGLGWFVYLFSINTWYTLQWSVVNMRVNVLLNLGGGRVLLFHSLGISAYYFSFLGIVRMNHLFLFELCGLFCTFLLLFFKVLPVHSPSSLEVPLGQPQPISATSCLFYFFITQITHLEERRGRRKIWETKRYPHGIFTRLIKISKLIKNV